MTVATRDPLDIAQDRVARLMLAPVEDPADQIVAALSCAALWRVVFEGAMRRGDHQLALIASKERRHALDAYLLLVSVGDGAPFACVPVAPGPSPPT